MRVPFALKHPQNNTITLLSLCILHGHFMAEAPPPPARWGDAKGARLSARPDDRDRTKPPALPMQPDAAPALTLCLVCALLTTGEGRGIERWARDGIVAAAKSRMIRAAKAEMQTSKMHDCRACMMLVGLSGCGFDRLSCMMGRRSGMQVVVGGAGGVREGCPPAAQARISPLHGCAQRLQCL